MKKQSKRSLRRPNNGRNRDFIVVGIKTVFKKNWNIDIDSHEIDSKLTYVENFMVLYNRHVRMKFSYEEFETL